MKKKALYLSGGGARGAYQAGVLKAIDHILQEKKLPFSIISGVSVGSINACVLAEHADDFSAGCERLNMLWREIQCKQVYNANNLELTKSLFRNVNALIFRKKQSAHLLNTEPLKAFIDQNINFNKINQNIKDNHFEAIEIMANCYESQQTISFFNHGTSDYESWHHPRHSSQLIALENKHVLASAALPLFFPTVKIDGYHYGDGGIGLVSPLRGAIHFKANKIMVLGTRHTAAFDHEAPPKNPYIGFAHILGTMMNGLFLDNLDRDLEMVHHMNEISRLLSMWKKRYTSWRPITTLHLRPSKNMARVAEEQFSNIPFFLRFFLNMMGAKSYSGDLLSFLLFEKEFTTELVKLGYQDTIASAEEVELFFKD